MGPEAPRFDPHAESIEDAARREMETDMAGSTEDESRRTAREEEAAWREYEEEKTHPEYDELPPEIREKAIEHDIPINVIEAAARFGISIDYLIHAKKSPAARRRLTEHSIDWGADYRSAGPEDSILPPQRPSKKLEDMDSLEREAYIGQLNNYLSHDIKEVADPVFYLEARGIKKRLEVRKIADQIEKEPKSLRKGLKRPGDLPLEMGRIPGLGHVGRAVGRLVIARSMHKKEIKELKKAGHGKSAEDGMLGIGIPRTRRNLEFLRRQDEDVRVIKNKLTLKNRYHYKGPEQSTARRDLAEFIIRTKNRQQAIKDRQLHHEDVYVHKPFKNALSDFTDKKKR